MHNPLYLHTNSIFIEYTVQLEINFDFSPQWLTLEWNSASVVHFYSIVESKIQQLGCWFLIDHMNMPTVNSIYIKIKSPIQVINMYDITLHDEAMEKTDQH